MNIKTVIMKIIGYAAGSLHRMLVSIRPLRSRVELGPDITVAVALYGGLGDAVMMLPALEMAKASIPGLKLAVYVEEKSAFNILELSELAEHLVLMSFRDYNTSFKRWRFIRSQVRPLSADVAMRNYLHTRFQDSVESYLTGARHRVGFVENQKSSIDTVFLYRKPYQHTVEDNADLFRAIGIDRKLDWPRIKLPAEDIEWSTRMLGYSSKDRTVIGIHPGGKARDRVKRWPEPYFAQLIDRLMLKNKVGVVLFGGPEDNPAIQQIIAKSRSQPLIAASQSLSKTAALIKNCEVFVSSDSGLMHLAALLNVPVVGLFGPTSSIKNGPWGRGHRIVNTDVSCAPCWAHDYRGCVDGRCMRRITVNQVYSTISEITRSYSISPLHGLKCRIRKDSRGPKVSQW